MKDKSNRHQEYYRKNKAKISKRNKRYYEENREKIRRQQRKYYLENKERLKVVHSENYYKNWKHLREGQAEYYQTYRDVINSRRKKFYEGNPKARVVRSLRSRLYSILKGKSKKTMDFIGCDRDHLNRHLEVQFKKGMTWANYGKVWVVDHHLPVSAFDHNNAKEVDACWHFSNLKPMWVKENMSKGKTICLER